ncbi:unnamed protein product [Arctogadus glacialis]
MSIRWPSLNHKQILGVMSIKHQVYCGLLPLRHSQDSYCVDVVKQPPLPLIMSACIFYLFFLVHFYIRSGVCCKAHKC